MRHLFWAVAICGFLVGLSSGYFYGIYNVCTKKKPGTVWVADKNGDLKCSPIHDPSGFLLREPEKWFEPEL